MNINLLLPFLFLTIAHSSISGTIGEYFDLNCKISDFYLKLEEVKINLKYFNLISCDKIITNPYIQKFSDLNQCCEELNYCYGRCETEKLFCDTHFNYCMEEICLENFAERNDLLNYESCKFLKEFHFSHKKSYGCEYFYYYKIQNKCIQL